MNLKEREDVMREIFETELLTLGNAKGHDYSGEEDSISNLRDFGVHGIIVRLGDKYHRLKNFTKAGTLHVKEESVEDTFKDMIIYIFLALIMYREDMKETEGTK